MTDDVEMLTTWIPVTDEALIDAGLATPAMIRRYERRRRAELAAWRALPIWVRAYRIARSRWGNVRWRLERTVRAFRGEDLDE